MVWARRCQKRSVHVAWPDVLPEGLAVGHQDLDPRLRLAHSLLVRLVEYLLDHGPRGLDDAHPARVDAPRAGVQHSEGRAVEPKNEAQVTRRGDHYARPPPLERGCATAQDLEGPQGVLWYGGALLKKPGGL